MAAVIALAGTPLGWVTQVQSNYGVQASTIAKSFNKTLEFPGGNDVYAMQTLSLIHI